MNNPVYPKIHFPEVYILEGGYCGYYKTSPHRCEPNGYITMDDPTHAASRREDLDQFRKARFGRHKSYTYGDGLSKTLMPSQGKRNTLPSGGPNQIFAAANAARTRRGGAALMTLPEDANVSVDADDTDTDLGDSPCPPPTKTATFKGKKMGRGTLVRAETYNPVRMVYWYIKSNWVSGGDALKSSYISPTPNMTRPIMNTFINWYLIFSWYDKTGETLASHHCTNTLVHSGKRCICFHYPSRPLPPPRLPIAQAPHFCIYIFISRAMRSVAPFSPFCFLISSTHGLVLVHADLNYPHASPHIYPSPMHLRFIKTEISGYVLLFLASCIASFRKQNTSGQVLGLSMHRIFYLLSSPFPRLVSNSLPIYFLLPGYVFCVHHFLSLVFMLLPTCIGQRRHQFTTENQYIQ